MSPRLGLVLTDPSQLHGWSPKDPIAFVAVQTTLIDPPRAAAARSLGDRIRKVAPDAEVLPYLWHFATHAPSDGLAARSTRKIEGEQPGHLADTSAVRQAWATTATVLEAMQARRVVVRTPPSFTPSALHRRRLTAFIEARKAEEVGVVWEPEGLWGAEEAVLSAPDATVIYRTKPDEIGEVESVWSRVDASVRGATAGIVADALEDGTLFLGDVRDLRAVAREL